MSRLVKDVAIIGGGAAGWWTGAYLAVKNPELNIQLIESDRIPTIGVGESMLPQVSEFFRDLGLEEQEWMARADAIYKLGNCFENWHKIGDRSIMTFWWNFGEELIKGSIYNRPGNKVFFGPKKTPRLADYWLYLYSIGEKSDEDFYYDFSDAAGLADCLCSPVDNDGHSYLGSWAGYAYHIDADKASRVVRDFAALPNGVEHIIGTVTKVELDENGVSQIQLCNDRTIKADLYIDCTGFARALIRHFDTTPYDYTDIACNSVCVSPIAYRDVRSEMVPYTRSRAREYGWQFVIPLTTRIGSGYVYSDRYVDDEDAVRQFKHWWRDHERLIPEPRVLKWRPSRLKQSWQKNVCSIGLSNGIIEPLEANVLYNAQYAIQTLSRLLDRNENHIEASTPRIFSRATARMLDHTADYIFHRYATTAREDTAFWRDYRRMGIERSAHESLWENYRKNTDPLTSLYPDAIWLSTAVYMKALRRDLRPKINPALLDNARAIFDYTARTSRNNGQIVPKIWEICPPNTALN